MELVKEITGDITSVTDGIIGHGVNCRGKMGSGVARALYEKWPAVKEEYLKLFEHMKPGPRLLGTVKFVEVEPNIVVANMFTQNFYGADGKRYAYPEMIKKCLDKVVLVAKMENKSVYIPRIGAGLGGLDWEKEVLPIVIEVSEIHKYPVIVMTL